VRIVLRADINPPGSLRGDARGGRTDTKDCQHYFRLTYHSINASAISVWRKVFI
jgi:hypothetical protein